MCPATPCRAGRWVSPAASPGWCCTAAPAARHSPVCWPRFLPPTTGLGHRSSAAPARWPRAAPGAGMWMRWWPTWKPCACRWGWRSGRCWAARGGRCWRWPTCANTRMPCAAWCCAAHSPAHRPTCGGCCNHWGPHCATPQAMTRATAPAHRTHPAHRAYPAIAFKCPPGWRVCNGCC